MNNLEILRNFPLYGEKDTLVNLLKEYELFKKTIEKPGDIVIIGNNIAIPLITFANFTEVQTIGDRTRLIYGFDNFVKNDIYKKEEDYIKMVSNNIFMYNQDRFVGWKDRVKYYSQENSFEYFLKKNLGIKISLLNCKDMKNNRKEIEELVNPCMIKKSEIIYV